MMQYEHLGDKRRSVTLSELEAAQMIGGRILCGFDVVQRWVRSRSGQRVQVTYFQSEITGKVWAVYF